MRKVTYGGACSLDGFIAGADGDLDWLHFSKDVQEIMAAFWVSVDTILMGRKTWEVSVGFGGESGGGAGIKTYVFSRTLEEITQPGVQLVSTDPAAFVRDLKQQPGGDICLMGGGELAQRLIEEDLVDEIGLNIHPILLGSGVPAFRDARHRVQLELIESRVLDGGCVLASYRVRIP